jgi:uncharacterized protein (DUF736 family)
MIIGRLNGDFENGMIGKIRTLTREGNFEILPTKTGTAFTAYLQGQEVGAAFRHTSKNGNEYLSLVLDDPFMMKPIQLAVIGQEKEFIVVYKRDKK